MERQQFIGDIQIGGNDGICSVEIHLNNGKIRIAGNQ